ncbi:MAG TPA: SDR family oxidoreductase [Gemmatimonadales bacterium]|nr:SDR family oxidoreductase [Gemmatimonadales bacterium]
MTILVIGATGTNGRYVVRGLHAAGQPVRALVRNPTTARALFGADTEYPELVEGDLNRPESLRPALLGIDTVFVALPSTEHFVVQAAAVTRAASAAGVRLVVKLSILGARADSPSEILANHARADAGLRDAGLATTLLRPNFFDQDLLWEAKDIQAEGAFHLPMGGARHSLIDARDIAAVAVAALTGTGHDGQTYVLTGPEALSYADVAAHLSEATGATVRYVPITPAAYRERLLAAGYPAWSAQAFADIDVAAQAEEFAQVTDTVARLTGRQPRRFAQFARDHADRFARRTR